MMSDNQFLKSLLNSLGAYVLLALRQSQTQTLGEYHDPNSAHCLSHWHWSLAIEAVTVMTLTQSKYFPVATVKVIINTHSVHS